MRTANLPLQVALQLQPLFNILVNFPMPCGQTIGDHLEAIFCKVLNLNFIVTKQKASPFCLFKRNTSSIFSVLKKNQT